MTLLFTRSTITQGRRVGKQGLCCFVGNALSNPTLEVLAVKKEAPRA